MTLILDTGPIVAASDPRDPIRPAIQQLLAAEPGELVIPAAVSAEIDYLLGQRLGQPAQRAFLADLAQGRFRVVCLETSEYELLLDYDERYTDLNVGLADLSVVLLAHRFQTRRILTLDERHFRALRPLDGGHFVLLPADPPQSGANGPVPRRHR